MNSLDDKAQGNFREREDVDRFLERFSELASSVGINLSPFLEGRVLDAGCGFGYLAMHLQVMGIDCYGVDSDQQAVLAARERVIFPDKIVHADIADLPFGEDFFDLVISNTIYDSIEEIFGHHLRLLALMGRDVDAKTEVREEKESFIDGVYTSTKRGGIYLVKDTRIGVEGMSFAGFEVRYDNKYSHVANLVLQK